MPSSNPPTLNTPAEHALLLALRTTSTPEDAWGTLVAALAAQPDGSLRLGVFLREAVRWRRPEAAPAFLAHGADPWNAGTPDEETAWEKTWRDTNRPLLRLFCAHDPSRVHPVVRALYAEPFGVGGLEHAAQTAAFPDHFPGRSQVMTLLCLEFTHRAELAPAMRTLWLRAHAERPEEAQFLARELALLAFPESSVLAFLMDALPEAWRHSDPDLMWGLENAMGIYERYEDTAVWARRFGEGQMTQRLLARAIGSRDRKNWPFFQELKRAAPLRPQPDSNTDPPLLSRDLLFALAGLALWKPDGSDMDPLLPETIRDVLNLVSDLPTDLSCVTEPDTHTDRTPVLWALADWHRQAETEGKNVNLDVLGALAEALVNRGARLSDEGSDGVSGYEALRAPLPVWVAQHEQNALTRTASDASASVRRPRF